MKAHKRGDRAALARVADRMGLVRLGEAIASREPGVGEAALAALPLAHGGVLLVGAATDQVAVSDWPRAAAAASALGALLDGAVPTALEEWEVPPDVVARACAALRALAWRSDAALADAAGGAGRGRGGGSELRQRRGSGAAGARRHAGAAARGDDGRGRRGRSARRCCATAIADGDRERQRGGDGSGVPDRGAHRAAAARPSRRPRRRSRRRATMAAAPTTPPEDAVEMLDCLAAAGTPQDRALLDELQRRPPSPLRDRAVELGVRPPSGKP